ncbi:MAG: LAGLIDADG family homing endonuclease [Candidatus Sungiibacteriota bacterium]
MPVFKKKNEDFFKKWSPEMAYVLGFFAADGSMFVNPRGSHYIGFYSADRNILKEVKAAMSLEHRIGTRKIRERARKRAYVLQIGSKTIFRDLQKLGFNPNKSKNIRMPTIPPQYISDFVRGYFDGDGNVAVCKYRRKDRGNRKARTMLSGFTSGSKLFLLGLRQYLQKHGGLGSGTLYFSSNAHRLYFSVNDSKRLYSLMYGNLSNQLFLPRKKERFESF